MVKPRLGASGCKIPAYLAMRLDFIDEEEGTSEWKAKAKAIIRAYYRTSLTERRKFRITWLEVFCEETAKLIREALEEKERSDAGRDD